MRRLRPSAASVPWTRFPREMAERRRVMRKCVFGAGVEEEGGGEAASAATVREAAVPLWAARSCSVMGAVRRERREMVRRPVIFDIDCNLN